MSPSSTHSTTSATSSTLASASSSASPQCFVKKNNTVTPSDWLPCGLTNRTTPNIPCCQSGDFCLSNGLCHYTYSLTGGSGYYAAGCTDQTYKDKTACPQLCDDRLNKDVVYNNSKGLWSCCGENSAGKPNCGNPTNEKFDAPPEVQLETYYTAGKKATSTSSSTSLSSSSSPSSSALSTSTETINASPTNTTSVPPSSGLSTGAAAGVGVACGMVGLALIGALIFVLLKRRRRRGILVGKSLSYKNEPVELSQDTRRTPSSDPGSAALVSSQAPTNEYVGELDTPMTPQELPADDIPSQTAPVAPRDILENLPESLRIRRPRT